MTLAGCLRWPQSLAGRVTLRVTLTLVVVLLLGVTIMALSSRRAAERIETVSLRLQSQQLLNHVVMENGLIRLRPSASLVDAYAAAGETMMYFVIGREGQVQVASSANALRVASEMRLPPAQADSWFFNLAGGTGSTISYNAMARGIPGSDGSTLVVARGYVHTLDLLREINEQGPGRFWWLIFLIVGAPVAVLLWSLRANLFRLREMAHHAAAIGPGSGPRHLPADTLPLEARQTVDAINGAFDRLSHAVEQQRDFTASVAHELRTPLTLLRGQVDGIGDRSLAAELRIDIDRMGRMVDQLLRLSQIDNATIDFAEAVDLVAIARDVVGTMAPLAIRSGVEIAVEAPDVPVTVAGSGQALWHALRNLVENAIQHSPRGGDVLVVIGPGGSVRVEDRGPGVAPEHRRKVFERFWRASSRGGGAGLGLAIVAQVAAAHGGSVQVGDRPGGGAVFILTLPAIFLRAVRSA